MKPLPPTTQALLQAIRDNERGSYREWAKTAGISSSSVVSAHLDRLECEGLIRRKVGVPRSVALTAKGKTYGVTNTDAPADRSDRHPGDRAVAGAIEVLRSFAAGDLDIPDNLAVELLDAAAEALNAPGVTYITCEIEDDTPIVESA